MRPVRAALAPERERLDVPRAGRLAPGGGSGVRQIGQFWMKRLWRQKLGGTTPSLGAAGRATSRYAPRLKPTTTSRRRDWTAVPARFHLPCALALAALCAAAAPPAQAAWTAPQTLVRDHAAANVSAAGNARGSQAFVWKVTARRIVRTRTQTGSASYVRGRIRLPDGRLGRVQTISSTGTIVADPQIGVDEHGDATAVWAQAGRHVTVMAAVRPHGKRFGTPFELGRSGHFADARPALAVGPDGDAVVAWNSGHSITVVRRGPSICQPRRARGCFRAPLRLRAGADQTVALGPLGSAYVVWAAEVRTAAVVHTRLRMTVIRRDGRSLGREHAVSRAADGDASQPSLAVRRHGAAVIAWRASLPAGGEQNDPAPIVAATSTAGAVASPPQIVSRHPGELPRMRIDSRGDAVLAWDQWNSTPANPDGQEIAVALQPAGAARFGAPTTITPPSVAGGGVSLAVDPVGDAYLVSSATGATPGGPAGISHVRPPGGDFGPPVALPVDFTGAFVFSAGATVTAVGGSGGRTLVSDWTA